MITFISTAKVPVFKAKRITRRPKTVTFKRLEALGAQMGNAVTLDLIKGMTTFKQRISAEAIADAWERGDYGRVLAHIKFEALPADLEKAFDRLGVTGRKAAQIQVEKLPANVNQRLRVDSTNPAIKRFLNKQTATLVTGIEMDAKRTIQDAVASSFQVAATPKQMAKRIKESIGLLPRHQTAVDNYRKGLTKAGIAPAKVEELSDAYADRLLYYRASMIARTETQAVLNFSQLEIWKEGVRQGYITGARKQWVAAGPAPCDFCDPMDGATTEIDDAWVTGDGTVVESLPAHPNCYCIQELHYSDEGEE